MQTDSWTMVLQCEAQALESGVLQPVCTRLEILADQQARFQLRICAALYRSFRPRLRTSAYAMALLPGRQEGIFEVSGELVSKEYPGLPAERAKFRLTETTVMGHPFRLLE